MISPNIICAVIAVIAVVLGAWAAEHASGHPPFSGYAEERLWGRVSLGLLLVATIFAALAMFL